MHTLTITVHPNSSQNKIKEITDLVFEVWLTATPIKGKANELLIKLLAKHFKTAKSNIQIKSGKTARDKVLIISA